MYYGAPEKYEQILSADQVGHGRPGEENRPDFRDVVFLTTSWEKARSYGAYVYEVDAPTAISYPVEYARRAAAGLLHRQKSRKNREKKVKTLFRDSQDIYVAKPEEVTIISCRHYPGTSKPGGLK